MHRGWGDKTFGVGQGSVHGACSPDGGLNLNAMKAFPCPQPFHLLMPHSHSCSRAMFCSSRRGRRTRWRWVCHIHSCTMRRTGRADSAPKREHQSDFMLWDTALPIHIILMSAAFSLSAEKTSG